MLAITFANVKSYRSALCSYRINMLYSIPSLLNQIQPMSLVPRDSLTKNLEVSKLQSQARDRLSLAIPMDKMLSYYEAQLLTNVVTIKEGLLMKIAIPLASRETSFTVFHASPVPMPQYEQDKAII